jgi:hypothetical protein
VKADYKPTSVQVITPAREYKNPFATSEAADVSAEEPVKVETPAAPVAVVEAAPTPEAEVHAPEAAVEEKAEIQILPPAESSRPAVSWESPSAAAARPESSYGERPTFRPDRRPESDRRPEPDAQAPRAEGREPRRDGRERRHDPYRGQPRDPRDEYPQRDERPRNEPAVQAESSQPEKPASKGFFGWLKGLFGGSKPVEAPAPQESSGRQYGDGHRPRRRHRGGRGHGGEGQGYRGDRPAQQPGEGRGPQGGEFENRGDRNGGPRRRRHRGGRGRDRGGEHRSEGRQGGGAI